MSLGLQIVVDDSISTFLDEAGPMLYQHEPTNSLMVGLLEGFKTQAPKVHPLLVRILENGKTVSAAVSFRLQPMNVIVTYSSEEQLRLLANHLKNTGEVFSGVVGPINESQKFADIWSAISGQKYELAMGQKIYKVEKVDFPKQMVGELKVATETDLDLVSKWVMAFVNESLPNDRRTDQQWKDLSARMIQKKNAYLWLVDGKIVSMANASRPTENGVSISGVYTPPDKRKKGYASAVVASLSQKMLDEGKKFCVLYTDLANPTSNKIYQEVGYREVCDSNHFNFVQS